MPINPVESSAVFNDIIVGNNVRPQKTGLADNFKDFLIKANEEMSAAEKNAQAFAAGEHNNIHETMIATERAVITFKLVGSVRNKMLMAYSEVMRMNI